MRTDVVIVGGGPAGTMAACRLAEGGRSVVLLERESGPHHKVCGEFLSGEARGYLASLGIDAGAMGGERIESFRLVHGRRMVATRLPFESIGISRKLIDEALLSAATARGVSVLRGHTVRAVSTTADGIRVETSDRLALEAGTAILATGKHDLRLSPRPLRESDDHIGLKIHLEPSPGQARALSGCVEIILFDGGYAGLQLVDEAAVNLCLVVRRPLFKQLGNDWRRLLTHLENGCPHLHERLALAKPLFDKPLSVYRIPYGFLHRASAGDPPRIFRVGDQAAVIQSFCGDGIAMALHTGALAAHSILAGEDAGSHHATLRRHLSAQMRHARMISALAERPAGQRLLVTAACLFPGLLQMAASATRVAPDAAQWFGFGFKAWSGSSHS